MIILDIGCGRKKIEGAIGVDFSPMSEADIVLDLKSEPLPFDDNSVDFIYSSHTLEHLTLEGFFHVAREAYRVLRSGRQFKIVVPYFTNTVNFANPFHNNNICFNEHTFRFFSSDAECYALSQKEYKTPSVPQWGLRYSANSELNIEFRTLRIDKFYFSEYEKSSISEKLIACQSKLNVAWQISYSLQAVKPCPIRPETGPVAQKVDLELYVNQQLDFLAKQLHYTEDQNFMLSPEIERGKQLIQSQKFQDSGLYITRDVLTPINFLIFELDDVIQALRRLIDEYQINIKS